jgi:hypothetical protein
MWREYFGFVAPALAVLNGLIAIVIALLSIRRSVLKLRLGVTALVFGIIAVGASYYAKHATRIQTEQQQADRNVVREQIDLHPRRPHTARPDPRRAARASVPAGRRMGAAVRSLPARPARRALCLALPQGRQRSLRRRLDRRAAHGLLARGAQPRGQSGADRGRAERAAARAACASRAKSVTIFASEILPE